MSRIATPSGVITHTLRILRRDPLRIGNGCPYSVNTECNAAYCYGVLLRFRTEQEKRGPRREGLRRSAQQGMAHTCSIVRTEQIALRRHGDERRHQSIRPAQKKPLCAQRAAGAGGRVERRATAAKQGPRHTSSRRRTLYLHLCSYARCACTQCSPSIRRTCTYLLRTGSRASRRRR